MDTAPNDNRRDQRWRSRIIDGTRSVFEKWVSPFEFGTMVVDGGTHLIYAVGHESPYVAHVYEIDFATKEIRREIRFESTGYILSSTIAHVSGKKRLYLATLPNVGDSDIFVFDLSSEHISQVGDYHLGRLYDLKTATDGYIIANHLVWDTPIVRIDPGSLKVIRGGMTGFGPITLKAGRRSNHIYAAGQDTEFGTHLKVIDADTLEEVVSKDMLGEPFVCDPSDDEQVVFAATDRRFLKLDGRTLADITNVPMALAPMQTTIECCRATENGRFLIVGTSSALLFDPLKHYGFIQVVDTMDARLTATVAVPAVMDLQPGHTATSVYAHCWHYSAATGTGISEIYLVETSEPTPPGERVARAAGDSRQPIPFRAAQKGAFSDGS